MAGVTATHTGDSGEGWTLGLGLVQIPPGKRLQSESENGS